MLKRQKPTKSPVRFQTKSISSLVEAVRNVCDNKDYIFEQSAGFTGSTKFGGGFMPKKGGGSFGSPETTNPTGKAGSKRGFSKPRGDTSAYFRYGLGIPALADLAGGALTSAEQFGGPFTAFGEKLALGGAAAAGWMDYLSGNNLQNLIKDAGFLQPTSPQKSRGTGGFKGV